MILKWPYHKKSRCSPDCPSCEIDACVNQVLFTCAVCWASEGELTTHCPGRRMTRYEREQILAGALDHVRGGWTWLK